MGCDVNSGNTKSESLEVFQVITGRMSPEQGDILFSCPYIYPIEVDFEKKTTKQWVQKWHVIILGNSCDIEQDKVDLVLLCPIWEINKYIENCKERFKLDEKYRKKFKNDEKELENQVKQLIKGASEDKRFGYTILPGVSQPNFETEPWLVDFTNTYTLPLDFLKDFCGADENNTFRLRLKTDYRSDLIGKFNYFLLRVVLPSHEFNYKKKHQAYYQWH